MCSATKQLQPRFYNELLRRLGDETTKGAPKFYAQRDNTDFYVAPIPNKNDSFRVVYSVKPTATSTSIPDTIGREYREALVHGALYRLQMMAVSPSPTLTLRLSTETYSKKWVAHSDRSSMDLVAVRLLANRGRLSNGLLNDNRPCATSVARDRITLKDSNTAATGQTLDPDDNYVCGPRSYRRPSVCVRLDRLHLSTPC